MDVVFDSKLNLPLIQKGKVRDIYAAGKDKMLIVTTDRLSAFDVVLSEPIPKKGSVLTAVSNFWFNKTTHITSNHLLNIPLTDFLSNKEAAQVSKRAIVVKKLTPLPVEAVIRGYLIGSGWNDYQRFGSVCGVKLPKGLRLAQQLPEVIYTPSTKAAIGAHDENISYDTTVKILGTSLAKKVKNLSLKLYKYAFLHAINKGVIIADTKFEFGLDENNNLVLMDEVLTPDSSRFWEKSKYSVGSNPKSFDKQIVRDYLETCNWNKKSPSTKADNTRITKN